MTGTARKSWDREGLKYTEEATARNDAVYRAPNIQTREPDTDTIVRISGWLVARTDNTLQRTLRRARRPSPATAGEGCETDAVAAGTGHENVPDVPPSTVSPEEEEAYEQA